MQKFRSVVLDPYGTALAGVSVHVYAANTTTPATIYSDDGATVQANPMTTDALGGFVFFAADGVYDILTVLGSNSVTTQDVVLAGGSPDSRGHSWVRQSRLSYNDVNNGLTYARVANIQADGFYRVSGWWQMSSIPFVSAFNGLILSQNNAPTFALSLNVSWQNNGGAFSAPGVAGVITTNNDGPTAVASVAWFEFYIHKIPSGISFDGVMNSAPTAANPYPRNRTFYGHCDLAPPDLVSIFNYAGGQLIAYDVVTELGVPL